jgi:hypothetical protein
MTPRIHTGLVTSIAAALVIVAATASVATAGGHGVRYTEPGSTGYVPTKMSIPANLANFREPGSTGYVPTKVTIPANLKNFREPGSVGFVPAAGAVVSAPGGGLDWASALIGGAVVLGIGFVSAGALLAMRRRRRLAHA